MRVQQSKIQRSKTACHAVQALLIFVAGCITIAIFTKAGTTDARTKYYFALCFFTMPALAYLAVVPMWSRTVRFANAYAFAVVDFIFTILWFAAFIVIATWNAAGMSAGAKEAKVDKGNCSTFAYGSELKCNLSKSTVGFGVIIFALFIATTIISFYYITVWRRTGIFDLASKNASPSTNSASYFASSTMYQPAAHTDDAWDSKIDDDMGPSHYGPDDFNHGPPVLPLPVACSAAGGAVYAPLIDDQDAHATQMHHPGARRSWGDHSSPPSQAFHVVTTAPSALSPDPNIYNGPPTPNYRT